MKITWLNIVKSTKLHILISFFLTYTFNFKLMTDKFF
ncbi:hypothetical protein EDF66_105114 [Sphingobacterium sp. JUb20]|nr:hypothetical protein [Sphingobacterium sp. JUb56]MCS3554492.1 hypothetical protein [Sphingobacterium sp. JUb21]TCR07483.1 hypothetical protein EDF66_105114 [Sphingobacterium sp. JUb20]